MKVSVLTPSFNSVKYIERAILSIQQQNYQSWEHIIMDAGSTDGTLNILKKYPHLQWISEPDKGQSDAMNKAFNKATGDIIVYLNADDFFEPNVFSEVVETFRATGADMVVGKLNKLNSKDIIYEVHEPSIELQDILDVAAVKFPLNPVSYFYKKELQEQIGPFPVDNHYTMDYWFLLRAYSKGKIIFINKVLGNFHEHGDNKTSAYFKTKLSQFDVLCEFCQEYTFEPYQYQRNLLNKVLVNYQSQQKHLSESLGRIQKTFWYKVGRKLNFIR